MGYNFQQDEKRGERMEAECAPLEGITTLWYRRTHWKRFGGAVRYYTPFLSPTREHCFTKRELREVAPEGNAGLPLVPQLLTRSAEDFLWAASALGDMGYREVNLNLGCPSGTVCAKGKGAGFLAAPEELDHFLGEVFARCPVAVSVKTRLGTEDPAEFDRLLEIFNQYPIARLIVHPRVRRDQYRGRPRLEAFRLAAERSRAPVCYNGDLCTAADGAAFQARFPQVGAVMLGRGLTGDPALARKLAGGPPASRAELEGFTAELYEAYSSGYGSRHSAVPRMKELWSFLICLFRDGGKHGKAIRKAKSPAEYEDRAAAVFRELELLSDLQPDWTDMDWKGCCI